MSRIIAVLLLSCQALTLTAQEKANPIRKVVTILQDMQKELEAEADKEKGLFEKFMCYCDGNTDGMSNAAKEAGQKITELESSLEAQKAEKSQLDQELIQHKQDRASAKKDLETAASIRAKEHEDFVASSGEQKANLEAMTGAIAALEKGMGGAFLQSGASKRVAMVVRGTSALDDYERQTVLSLFESKAANPFGDYSGRSGEIVGMLKAMKDSMDKALNGAVSDEEAAAKGYEELKAAKSAEVASSSEAIEAKTARSGELAVAIVTTKDDLKDTTAELNDTQAFLANLASQCDTKKKEWAERSKIRSEEVAAISEAIKILNDDDALDLFKKTLSLAQQQESMGFLQQRSKESLALRARALMHVLAKKDTRHSAQLALIQYSLRAKAVDFSKILAQIDGMVEVLGNEQADDDSQKAFCDKDLAKSEKEKKATEDAIAMSKASIEEMSASSETLAEEVSSLQAEIKALDKAVAEATEQRKEEHADFLQFQTENNAALQLIDKAKNRLFKFYRPTVYKEQAKQELTDEEKILAASGRSDLIATTPVPMIAEGTAAAQAAWLQVPAFVQLKDDAAPPPPPATWDAYQKKDGKSNGVIALMEMLMKELQGDMKDAEHEEKTAQKDYEALMGDSQKSRAQNVESITSKEAAKAELDMKIENAKETLATQGSELMNIGHYIAQLHGSCDFLIDNYDLRKQARANEVDGLKNAKGVLSGASFE